MSPPRPDAETAEATPLAAALDEGNHLIAAFDDGSVRFIPPHTKDDADYRDRFDPDFDADHERCRSCVHYIEGGGCHFVRGRIDPAAYCAEFFADYGVFAHAHADHVEVNSELAGPTWDYDTPAIHDFVDEIEERLQQRQREQPGPRTGGD